MRIKLAILEHDRGFLKRVTDTFSTKYADRLTIYSSTSEEETLNYIRENRIDVFLVSDYFEIDAGAIPSRTQMAYLTDDPDTEEIRGCRSVFKFQKADYLFKQILSLNAEAAGKSQRRSDGSGGEVIVFTSPCGGTGTSTAAAAYACHLAEQGRRVLYLDYSDFGQPEYFFNAAGPFTMSDVLYNLQKKTNFAMKLESFVRRDSFGVFFYAAPAEALDMMEMTMADKTELLNEIESLGSYEYIILDLPFSLSEESRKLMRCAKEIVWVSDGSEAANRKIARAYAALEILEEDAAAPLSARTCLLYNRFSSHSGRELEGVDLRVIGGAGRCDYQNVEQLLTFLAAKDFYDLILQ